MKFYVIGIFIFLFLLCVIRFFLRFKSFEKVLNVFFFLFYYYCLSLVIFLENGEVWVFVRWKGFNIFIFYNIRVIEYEILVRFCFFRKC